MGAQITVTVRLRNGETVNVTNKDGWDSFLANFYAMKAVVCVGFWIPMDMVASITPADTAVASEPLMQAQTLQ